MAELKPFYLDPKQTELGIKAAQAQANPQPAPVQQPLRPIPTPAPEPAGPVDMEPAPPAPEPEMPQPDAGAPAPPPAPTGTAVETPAQKEIRDQAQFHLQRAQAALDERDKSQPPTLEHHKANLGIHLVGMLLTGLDPTRQAGAALVNSYNGAVSQRENQDYQVKNNAWLKVNQNLTSKAKDEQGMGASLLKQYEAGQALLSKEKVSGDTAKAKEIESKLKDDRQKVIDHQNKVKGYEGRYESGVRLLEGAGTEHERKLAATSILHTIKDLRDTGDYDSAELDEMEKNAHFAFANPGKKESDTKLASDLKKLQIENAKLRNKFMPIVQDQKTQAFNERMALWHQVFAFNGKKMPIELQKYEQDVARFLSAPTEREKFDAQQAQRYLGASSQLTNILMRKKASILADIAHQPQDKVTHAVIETPITRGLREKANAYTQLINESIKRTQAIKAKIGNEAPTGYSLPDDTPDMGSTPNAAPKDKSFIGPIQGKVKYEKGKTYKTSKGVKFTVG